MPGSSSPWGHSWISPSARTGSGNAAPLDLKGLWESMEWGWVNLGKRSLGQEKS